MITIDIDGQIEARQAQIEALEQQLKDLALLPVELAADSFHQLEDKIEQAKAFIEAIEAA